MENRFTDIEKRYYYSLFIKWLHKAEYVSVTPMSINDCINNFH